MTGTTCFEAGTTAVTFRYQDSAGKMGTASANLTVRMFGDLNADNGVDPSDMVVLRAYFNFAVSCLAP